MFLVTLNPNFLSVSPTSNCPDNCDIGFSHWLLCDILWITLVKDQNADEPVEQSLAAQNPTGEDSVLKFSLNERTSKLEIENLVWRYDESIYQ